MGVNLQCWWRAVVTFLSTRSPGILIFMEIAHDIATALYHTGLDPFTGEEVAVEGSSVA
jgi:hypothetical protein